MRIRKIIKCFHPTIEIVGFFANVIVRIRNEHTEHLREQDLLLNIIRNQSKPQFFREVGANIVGSAVWDGLLYLGSKLCKL